MVYTVDNMSMSRDTYRGVLFDVDDTLYNVGTLMCLQWQQADQALVQAGIDPAELCEAYLQVKTTCRYTSLLPKLLNHIRGDLAHVQLLKDIIDGGVPTGLTPYPGTKDLLDDLKRHGVKLGVVTNGDTTRQKAKLDELGLTHYFDTIVVAGDSVPAKPNKAPFLLATSEMGLVPDEVIMVGDRVDCDIIPAHELGMGTLRIQLGNRAEVQTPPDCDYVTTDPLDAWTHLLEITTLMGTIPLQDHAQKASTTGSPITR